MRNGPMFSLTPVHKPMPLFFLAVLNPGDKFMGLNLAHGGHLSHGSLVNTSGIIYTPCEYNLNKETGRVDYDQMEEVALRESRK